MCENQCKLLERTGDLWVEVFGFKKMHLDLRNQRRSIWFQQSHSERSPKKKCTVILVQRTFMRAHERKLYKYKALDPALVFMEIRNIGIKTTPVNYDHRSPYLDVRWFWWFFPKCRWRRVPVSIVRVVSATCVSAFGWGDAFTRHFEAFCKCAVFLATCNEFVKLVDRSMWCDWIGIDNGI